MSRSHRVAALALAGASLILACSETRDPLAPRDDQVPSFDFTNGPSNPGPFVLRFQAGGFAFINEDVEDELVAVIAIPDDPSNWGFFCNGSDFQVLDWQLVLHSAGTINAVIRSREVNIFIYDRADLLAKGFTCDFFTTPRLYEGSGRVTYTDNDFAVTGLHTNAFGWHALGILEDLVEGGEVRANIVGRAQITPSGELKVLRDDVDVRPR